MLNLFLWIGYIKLQDFKNLRQRIWDKVRRYGKHVGNPLKNSEQNENFMEIALGITSSIMRGLWTCH
jgi:hypothetical protein